MRDWRKLILAEKQAISHDGKKRKLPENHSGSVDRGRAVFPVVCLGKNGLLAIFVIVRAAMGIRKVLSNLIELFAASRRCPDRFLFGSVSCANDRLVLDLRGGRFVAVVAWEAKQRKRASERR